MAIGIISNQQEKDMQRPRANLMMTLFISEHNPLLQRVLRYASPSRPAGQPVTESELGSVTGIGRGTPRNWAIGKPMSEKASDAFVRAVAFLDAAHERNLAFGRADEQEYRSIRQAISHFAAHFRNPDMRVHRAADCLGMPVDQAQRVIERAIQDTTPAPMTSVWYPPERQVTGTDLAKVHLKRYGGAHLVMMRWMPDNGHAIWLQCPLHLRYLVEVKSAHRFLRAKLCYPQLSPADNATRVIEFDGTLTVLEHALDWRFETRRTEERNLLTFMTSASPVAAGCMVGSYVTTAADRRPVRGEMFTEFMFADAENPYQHTYRAFMAEKAMIFDDAVSVARIEQRMAFINSVKDHPALALSG